MRLAPVLLIVAVMVLGSVPLLAQADAAVVDSYTKKMVTLNSFELYSTSEYGEWGLLYDPMEPAGHPAFPAAASLTNLYSTDRTQGNYSYVRELSWTNTSVLYQGYEFDLNDYFGGLRFYDVQFDYKIVVTIDDTSDLSYGVSLQAYESNDWIKRDLAMDGAWHTGSVRPYYNDSVPTWFRFYVSIFQTYDVSHPYHSCNGTISLYLDNIVAYAPACDVRFSFYNAYTGTGLDRSELIIQVWYDGVWTRIWDNEYRIAAGEHIGYKVTDYFGQTVAFVTDLRLDHTTVYVDLPVNLVKVHISRPEWYTTDLPPTWYLTYTATGKEIPVEGWDLELIAGLYSFRWDAMTVSKGNDSLDPNDDLVIEEGDIGQYIDGNLSSGQSFTVTDFYLAMKPTYRSEDPNTTHVIPSLYSWDGLVATFNQAYDEISSNPLYRGVTMAMGIMGAVTFLSAAVYSGKRKAARKLKEEQTKRGGTF